MRKKEFSNCIFCDPNPCTCNDPIKATKTEKKFKPQAKAKISDPETETKKNSGPAFDLTEFKPEPVSRFKAPEKKIERDLSLEEAVRNLYPLLSKRDQGRVSKYLSRKPSGELERRIIEWKKNVK